MAEDEGDEQSDAPILQVLVTHANTGGLTLDVTLQVGGLLVSGTLASFDEYLRAVAGVFGTEPAEEHEDGGEPDEDENKRQPRYIHLRDFQIYEPGRPSPIPSDKPPESIWWRGRISHVDGFFLGRLGIPSD